MTDRATALREAGRDIISLSVGEPDFATPPHVIEAAKAALDAGATKYTPVTGTLALKKAATLHFQRDLGIATDPSRVIVTRRGQAGDLRGAGRHRKRRRRGDRAIAVVGQLSADGALCRRRVVPLRTHAHHNFRFDPGDVEALITPRTNWLMLNSAPAIPPARCSRRTCCWASPRCCAAIRR
jgi:aspartate aminotransferase